MAQPQLDALFAFAAEMFAAAATEILAPAAPQASPAHLHGAVGRSGCEHYRTNPICRPLPREPVISPYSHAWAAAEFQTGRDYFSSFGANTGIMRLGPFTLSKDGSDPPVGHVTAGSAVVAQVVACDRAAWSSHTCEAQKMNGATVNFPVGAEPAGNSDHHYSWLDDVKRGNFDCWLCARPTSPGAVIHVGGLGFCPWDKNAPGDELGDGTSCSNATATNIETTLGSIAEADFSASAEDPVHGTFGHAIAFSALCADTTFVFPATASDGSNTNGTAACASYLGAHGRPPEGTRLFLDMSDEAVDALPLPSYNKAWLRTLDREHYGGIITDTNWDGAPGLSAAYRRDDFAPEARAAGVTPSPFAAIPIDLASVNLARDIRFCASGDCR